MAEAERAMREQAASIADRMEFDSFHRSIGNESYGLGFEDGCNHYAAFIADAIRALPLSSDESLTEQERQTLLLTAQGVSKGQDPSSSG